MSSCIYFTVSREGPRQTPLPLCALGDLRVKKHPQTSSPKSTVRAKTCKKAANLPFCFQQLPGCSSRNPFLFMFLHRCRGMAIPPKASRPNVLLELRGDRSSFGRFSDFEFRAWELAQRSPSGRKSWLGWQNLVAQQVRPQDEIDDRIRVQPEQDGAHKGDKQHGVYA